MSSPGRLGNPSVGPPAIQRKGLKMPVYQQGEDIENYLLRFERMAKTWQWPREEWACRLIPLLTRKALVAYTAMDEDRSNCYTDLREGLLVNFDISSETYHCSVRDKDFCMLSLSAAGTQSVHLPPEEAKTDWTVLCA